MLSGVLFWALLPLRVSLLGTHPVVAELLNGSTESIISAAAFARVGHGTLAVVLLAAIPGLMKFDILYWWAGRLWGERFIMALPGSRRAAKYLGRVQRAGPKFTWPAMVLSSFLPIPRAIIFVIVGWAGMRLVTFFILDVISVLLWALLAGLGLRSVTTLSSRPRQSRTTVVVHDRNRGAGVLAVLRSQRSR